MPVPSRVREEAPAADAEMRRLAAEAPQPAAQVVPAGSPTHPSPEDPPAPSSLDSLPPRDVPHPNAVPDKAAPAEGPGGEPITAEKYAELLQKYETLQGLHNKDQQKLAQTEGRLETLERIMQAQAAARAAEPQEPAPPAKREPKALVTKEEIDDFGADLTDFTRRLAREEFGPAIDDVLEQLQKLQTKVAQLSQVAGSAAEVAATTAEERFCVEMDRLVQGADGTPNWREINDDQNFIDWLQNVGQDSDEPRQVVLVRAYQRKDARKCAGFFNAYKREKGLPEGPAAQGAPPAPQAEPANPAASLVSPSPVAPAAPTSNRGKGKTYRLAEIEQVYSDYTKGKYKGREAEYRQLTAEFDKAAQEGRVIK